MSADRKDLGEPIPWTDEDLDALSVITPADIASARAWWHRNAPEWAKDLIDADPGAEDDG